MIYTRYHSNHLYQLVRGLFSSYFEIIMKNKNISLDPLKLRGYIDQVGYEKDPILSELRNKTELLGDVAIMQIGETQGSLIEILCQLGQFTKCIEIGVFTGYSEFCDALG